MFPNTSLNLVIFDLVTLTLSSDLKHPQTTTDYICIKVLFGYDHIDQRFKHHPGG